MVDVDEFLNKNSIEVRCISCNKVLFNREHSEGFEIRHSYCYCKDCAEEQDLMATLDLSDDEIEELDGDAEDQEYEDWNDGIADDEPFEVPDDLLKEHDNLCESCEWDFDPDTDECKHCFAQVIFLANDDEQE